MNTEIIERYLLNQMTAEEKAAFEKALLTDSDLKNELDTQQELMHAIEKTALTTELKQAIKVHALKKIIMQWSAAIIISAIVAFVSYYAYVNIKTGGTTLRYETNELGTKEFADADKYLPSQLFSINSNADTILETNNGIVFAIPAHAFRNADGSDARGNIDIEIKEALTTSDILKAGLSTMSNNELLETGGMFYFNARSTNNNLTLAKEINASVPTNEIKPGMKLFEGVRNADGSINWVNPVALDKDLTTFNITDLDFYPPNYIPTLQKLGLDFKNKKYTDSLYYSFAGYGIPSINSDSTVVGNMIEISDDGEVYAVIRNVDRHFKNITSYYACLDSISKSDIGKADISNHTSNYNYEIDPARIKAIWNEKFNNTILATKEFEERLKYIELEFVFCESQSNDVLLTYISNIDKPLFYSDSILMQMVSGCGAHSRFEEFYQRHDGGVKVSSELQQKLRDYFIKRSALLQQIGEQTWLKIYEEAAVKDGEAMQKQSTHQYLEDLRNKSNFKEEYDKNFKEACKQLNCTHTYGNTAPKSYNAKFMSMGWKNIDQYVNESTTNRTSLNYVDPVTGKKAEIKYTPFSVTVTGSYERTLVYLIPKELSSFQRVKQDGNIFKEKLNEFIKYDVVVLAYNGNEIFYNIEKNIEAKDYTFNLNKISQEELSKKLRNISSDKRNEMNEEVAYQVFVQKEVERKRIQRMADEQRLIIATSIFPCLQQDSTSAQ